MREHTEREAIIGLRITPDGRASGVSLQPTNGSHLDALYEAIGCRFVDVVRLRDGLDMWVDDEGLYTAEPNLFATTLADQLTPGGAVQIYHGTAVFLGADDDTGETVSVPGAAELIGFTVGEVVEVLRTQ